MRIRSSQLSAIHQHLELYEGILESSFEHILILDGNCVLGSDQYKDMRLEKGDSVFLPAGYGDFYIDGKCTFIKTKIDNQK